MTEKEKMFKGLLYNANYDPELIEERMQCKSLCQKYNRLDIRNLEERTNLIKEILGRTGEQILIEPDFWCDYGYRTEVGENFYANHGLILLDAGMIIFGDNVFIGPNCGFHTSGHPLDYQTRNQGLEYGHPITVGNNVWFGAAVQVMPGVTIGDNCVIGSGSIVTTDIPADCVAAGNPCKVIRSIKEEKPSGFWQTSDRKVKEQEQIYVPDFAKRYIGRDYKEVVAELEKAGFCRIETSEKLVRKGLFTKNHSVNSIEINGKKDFIKGEWYDKSAVVHIVFQTVQ